MSNAGDTPVVECLDARMVRRVLVERVAEGCPFLQTGLYSVFESFIQPPPNTLWVIHCCPDVLDGPQCEKLCDLR